MGMLPEGLTDTKEVIEITENFKKNKSLDYLGRELTKVAEKLKTSPNIVWIQWANEMNRKEYGVDGYECEESKSGKVKCYECTHFLHDRDTCSGNSIIAPLLRVTDPNYKPPHFSDAGPTKIIPLK